MSLAGLSSLQDWAEHLAGLIDKTVSKQAIWKRVNKNLLPCLKSILLKAFHSQIKSRYMTCKTGSLLSYFGRVFIQDSTNIHLPNMLTKFYKGNKSKGQQKSVMRIQVVYELLTGAFQTFNIGSFTDNDQGAAGNIIKTLKTGDLVIRDLGYFVIKIFRNIVETGAFFLTRFKYGCNIYCPVTGDEIRLVDLLKGNFVDINILLGAKEKFGCRMVAIKLPEKVAAERRRKAKNDRDKRLNHSKEYMQLLGWAIFYTNVSRNVWDYKAIIEVYKIRWHIEIIFKGWKSHFSIDKLIPEKPLKKEITDIDIERYKIRVDTVIYTMLIFIILFHIHFYIYFAGAIYKKKGIFISYLKICSFIKKHKDRILASLDWELFEKEISYYTAYEKRKKREDFLELYLKLITNG